MIASLIMMVGSILWFLEELGEDRTLRAFAWLGVFLYASGMLMLLGTL